MFQFKSDDDVPVVATAVAVADPPPAADPLGFQMGKTYYACVAQFPEAFEAVLLWYDPTKGFKIKPVGHDETGIVENLYHSKDAAQTALLAMKQEKLSGVGAHKPSTATATAATTATNTTTHDNKALELVISRLENVATCIETDRNVEISMLKCSLEGLRQQFDELRAWDTVRVTWKVPPFSRADMYSSNFSVAQHTLRLHMQRSGDTQYGYLGFYIAHTKGEYDRLPIEVGGSMISVVGNEDKDTTERKLRGWAVIEKATGAAGWKEFVPMKDLDKKFVNNGMLTLKATVRVRRSTIANLNLK